MNRFIKSVVALIAVSAITVPVFAAFDDINGEEYSWAKNYINSMAQQGLISGYEDGTFRPDNDVTRLEALSLFARAMGSNNNLNQDIVKIAHEKYDSVISNYNLRWGTDEIAYLMYKGALKKADLDTYLKDQEKDAPMRRYEAAIIITKALGGEDKALSDFGVVLDYNDAREVPSNAIQYVAYATEAGIMEGMGEGEFSPNTEVKRSQMAVMLSRTVDVTNYSYSSMKIVDVDTDSKIITAANSAGVSEKINYSDETKMKNYGDEVLASTLSKNIRAIFAFSGSKLISVDTVTKSPDQVITGKYVSYTSRSGKSIVTITPNGEIDSQSYECDETISVTYDNTPATVRSFTRGDIVSIAVSNGKIVKMQGETKESTITGAIVDSLNVGTDITMTITHGNDEYNGKTYAISNDVSVKKNDASSSLDKIYKGDKVTLTLEYGVITKISASSNRKVVDGVIRSLTFSNQSEMTVRVNDKDTTYQIPNDVEVTINGEEGSLYDFRVGDVVKLTLQSDAITSIVATSTQESSGSMSGVVTGINTSYGVITVLSEGSTEAKQAFCKDDTTNIVTVDGKSKKMKDIKVGQTVEIKGTVSNGVFVGKLLIIVADEN